ncbi:MAG: phosphoribosylaminoimidazolesuccinocarboxamide synthase [Acidobacteriota bacterium]|nr:phosphoribosylaminoimidazolesuccinocarboxamide synthase [Acidobacteriota bacterium]MDQ7086641.1 phosphoribosylaminoimidazolesuccinocarboxamide synthase [Acidobacteriota bacterium]
MNAVVETRLPGMDLLSRGKVRDIYAFGDQLLLIATDRISAFDVILPQPIPDKGKVLHQVSSFWFEWSKDLVGNHLVAERIADFPAELQGWADQLAGRSALVRRAEMFPVECVARGYLSGSGWKDYCATNKVCGISLPEGLVESEQLPEPIFTPATKAETGHDENISFDTMAALVGGERAEQLRFLTLELYRKAAAFALERGIIIADTKFEFGMIDGKVVICDEMLTPDSSRFWPRDAYTPGRAQPSFDKQFVRDYLETLDWDKTPPGPDLPDEVVSGTRKRYLEILEILTGSGLWPE